MSRIAAQDNDGLLKGKNKKLADDSDEGDFAVPKEQNNDSVRIPEQVDDDNLKVPAMH